MSERNAKGKTFVMSFVLSTIRSRTNSSLFFCAKALYQSCHTINTLAEKVGFNGTHPKTIRGSDREPPCPKFGTNSGFSFPNFEREPFHCVKSFCDFVMA